MNCQDSYCMYNSKGLCTCKEKISLDEDHSCEQFEEAEDES
jgi:hypothetical protein